MIIKVSSLLYNQNRILHKLKMERNFSDVRDNWKTIYER